MTAATKLKNKKKKNLAPWKKNYGKLKQHIKKQRHYFTGKGLHNQSYGFPVVIYAWES